MTVTDTTSGWQLDDAAATAYERNLVPRFFAPFAVDLVSDLGPLSGRHVLDVACGTGAVSRVAAAAVGNEGAVTAVDLSPAMLSVASGVLDGAGVAVKLEQADASDLPLPDGSVDAVACQQALQFFPDPSAALAEMLRVLVPVGRLAVSTCGALDHQPGYRILVDVLTRHVGADAAQITASPYTLGDPARLAGLVAGAGFDDVDVTERTYTVRFGSPEEFLVAETSSSPLGLLVDGLDPDVRERLVDDLTSHLASYTEDGAIVFPFRVLAARASRP